jgi:hypothetical protein
MRVLRVCVLRFGYGPVWSEVRPRQGERLPFFVHSDRTFVRREEAERALALRIFGDVFDSGFIMDQLPLEAATLVR